MTTSIITINGVQVTIGFNANIITIDSKPVAVVDQQSSIIYLIKNSSRHYWILNQHPLLKGATINRTFSKNLPINKPYRHG
jgi:hypothetical protein